MPLPSYYSSLTPFRRVFETGTPVLTYHHIGRAPRGARLKGLYLSPGLLERQLKELAKAGFQTANLEMLNSPARQSSASAAPARQICLTFDDGFLDVFEQALPLLRRERVNATVYLVANLIGKTNEWQQRVGDVVEALMEEAQVREWLAAGLRIGSHTLTHPRLSQIPLAAAREEIFASKKALEDRFGVPIDHFCYPYGDYNEAVRDLAGEAGYRTATTTRSGINPPGAPPLELKRFTARYPSRNMKAVWRRFRAWMGNYGD
jgi:peptidoglycan/xylan/chitin deacetylase (PgdA/CDA1 family)